MGMIGRTPNTKKIDTVPTEKDFKKTVADYLSWKVSTILKEENHENFQ